MRHLLGQMLEAAGHEVLLATDGEKGLRFHRARPADLVITDIFMPVREGLETIRAFRKEFPKVPIIAVSGRPDLANSLYLAQQLGATRVLPKPFESDVMMAMVNSVLQPPPGGMSKGDTVPPGV